MARKKSDATGGEPAATENHDDDAATLPEADRTEDAGGAAESPDVPIATTDIPDSRETASDGTGPDAATVADAPDEAVEQSDDPYLAEDPPTEHETESPTEFHEDQVEGDAAPSFSSRVLTGLLLLLVGAGVGIWAAPKIATVLPSGMAPVAAWLTPGASRSEARIAELESRVESGLGDVTARIADLAPQDDVAARIDTSVEAAASDLRGSLGGEIAGLRDEIADLDGAETRQRLARLEAGIDGQKAEVSSLKSQLTGGAEATSALTEETVNRIDTYRAELDGLRAELAAQSDKVGALSARIDEVASAADRQIETAQARVAEIETSSATRLTAATARSDGARVRAALADGEPFTDALARLEADASIAVPEGLAAVAETGVPTLTQLKDSFPDAAHEAIRASVMASAGDGFLGRSNAFLRAQIASRSLTAQEGMSPDAVLSRMERSLRDDDLEGALAEADGLTSESADAMGDWLADARRRADAEAGLDALTDALPATN